MKLNDLSKEDLESVGIKPFEDEARASAELADREAPKELTPVEEAILALAEYLEYVNHDEYAVRKHIMEILGVEKKPLANPTVL